MKENLHVKRTLRTILLVLLLSVVGMTNAYADGFNFSAVCPSGQTLYYKYIDGPFGGRVEVTVPYSETPGYPYSEIVLWDGYTKPSGEVVIPESVNGYRVTSINGFTECSDLIAVTIPNSVEKIGLYAFKNCTRLASITIPNSVKEIEDGVFYASPYQPSGGAFLGCSNLTSVSIGDSVQKIGDLAFLGCSKLKNINIPNSVVTIGGGAFSDCIDLSSIVIPNSVINIEDGGGYWIGGGSTYPKGAFSGCTNLTSVIIGESVSKIGDLAFYGCTGLTTINIPNSVETIGGGAFSGCNGLTSIMIPDSVESIKDAFIIWNGSSNDSIGVFSSCENLTNVTIGKSIKTIGEKAFANNPRLNMVYYNVEKALEVGTISLFGVQVPNPITNVFDNCPNLTTIHIGPDVKQIGSYIFKGCNTVHFVVALGPTPAVLDVGAFSDIVDNSMLMVSCGNKVTYFSVWNMFPFNNIIEDCNTYSIESGVVGSGGNVTVSASNAQMGEEVQLTVTPNPGMHLTSLIVCNTNDPTQIIPVNLVGKATSTYSFTMPPFGVVVMATFAAGTSVFEINGIPCAVYPNPTNGFVKIEAEGIKSISVFNLNGQQILNGQIIDNEFEFDLSGHEAGIYLIRIETSKGITMKRVVLTK